MRKTEKRVLVYGLQVVGCEEAVQRDDFTHNIPTNCCPTQRNSLLSSHPNTSKTTINTIRIPAALHVCFEGRGDSVTPGDRSEGDSLFKRRDSPLINLLYDASSDSQNAQMHVQARLGCMPIRESILQ